MKLRQSVSGGDLILDCGCLVYDGSEDNHRFFILSGCLGKCRKRKAVVDHIWMRLDKLFQLNGCGLVSFKRFYEPDNIQICGNILRILLRDSTKFLFRVILLTVLQVKPDKAFPKCAAVRVIRNQFLKDLGDFTLLSKRFKSSYLDNLKLGISLAMAKAGVQNFNCRLRIALRQFFCRQYQD